MKTFRKLFLALLGIEIFIVFWFLFFTNATSICGSYSLLTPFGDPNERACLAAIDHFSPNFRFYIISDIFLLTAIIGILIAMGTILVRGTNMEVKAESKKIAMYSMGSIIVFFAIYIGRAILINYIFLSKTLL